MWFKCVLFKTIPFGSISAPTSNSVQLINSITWQTEYNTITNVVSGETYESSSSCGGYITVRSGTFDGSLVGHGNSPLSWTATVNGNHYIHYNTNSSCGTATNNCSTYITCTSCPPVIGDGCVVQPPACVTDYGAWQTVINNDPWCCNNLWDGLCQDAYNELSITCP